MSELLLTLRAAPQERIDASSVTSHRLAATTLAAVERLPLRTESGESLVIADLFTVRGKPSEIVRLVGEFSSFDGIASGMSGGSLHIEGNAGRRLGWRMAGGAVKVAGDAGDGTGLEMAGGRILIRGSVGARTGAALPGAKRGMSGGEILVFGDAGSETGACLRRGLIAVAGSLGPDALRDAIAGTVLCLGSATGPVARWSKRASLVVFGDVVIPPTFLYACTYRPSFLAVLLTHLARSAGFPVSAEQTAGLYRRFIGDVAESTRGEILHWTGA